MTSYFDEVMQQLEPYIKTRAKCEKTLTANRKKLSEQESKLAGLKRRRQEIIDRARDQVDDSKQFAKLQTKLKRNSTDTVDLTDIIEVIVKNVTAAQKAYDQAERELIDQLHKATVSACDVCSARMTELFDAVVAERDTYLDQASDIHNELALPFRQSLPEVLPRCEHERIQGVSQQGAADTIRSVVISPREISELPIARRIKRDRQAKRAKPEPLEKIPELDLPAASSAEVAMALAELENAPKAALADSEEGRANRDWPNAK